ncbi:MAG: hypothetical protein JSW59_03690 [Phycisphaerales bacterium]|nr:MAG: hypothetical protein JSW59_03690 [Phycisphaerales bacterium]
MIKTLRITSVLAAIAAGVLIYYFIIPMVVGADGDERIDKALDAATVVENFREKKGPNRSPKGDISPLVEQALAFAGHLAPGRVVQPRMGVSGTSRQPRPPTTPKFKVFATTYFAGNPALSQALIDEPGKGRYWVRQSSMVSGLLIEQVKDGAVVVKSSKDTYELEVESNPQAAAVKRTSPASKSITGRSPTKRYSPTHSRSASGVSRTPTRPSPQTEGSEISEREKAADDLVKRLRVLQEGRTGADKERIAELISTFQSKVVGAQSNESPENSGKKVTSTAKDPNQASSMIRGGKIDTGSVKPDTKTQK